MKFIENFKEKHKNKKWFQFIFELLERVNEDQVVTSGAELAYFLLFSLFPFLIFLLNIVGMMPIASTGAITNAIGYLPDNVSDVLTPIVDSMIRSSSGTLLSASLILALWSGSNGLISVVRQMNKAYNLEETRSFVVLRLHGLLYTLSLVLLIILLLVSQVFADLIINAVYSLFGYHSLVDMLWQIFRNLIPLVVMILGFTLFYRFGPNFKHHTKITFSEALIGGAFTSIAWIILSVGFSFYVDNFSNFDATYGSLGGVIALMTWLFLSSLVIMLGAQISATYVSVIKNRKYRPSIHETVKQMDWTS